MFKNYTSELIHEEIATDIFATHIRAVTDCSREAAENLAIKIHPNFREIIISHLIGLSECDSMTLKQAEKYFGNTILSATWALRYQCRNIIRKVFKL